MEWIKRMSLKKALFVLTLVNLAAAGFLSALSFWGCMELGRRIAPNGVLLEPGTDPVTKIVLPEASKEAQLLANVLSVLQLALPVVFLVFALILTVTLFYRWKLKEPLAVLSEGAGRIIDNDLDFAIPVTGEDELGQLCRAFETMRRALLDNNRRLWQQAEERRRLNAAFSHELRNPVTVLKGSVKLARQSVEKGNADREQLLAHLTRMEAYTQRMEEYVAAMSSVQRLEQVPLNRQWTPVGQLAAELAETLELMGAKAGKSVAFEKKPADMNATEWSGKVYVDGAVVLRVAENLAANALRFAGKKVVIALTEEAGILRLTVTDDGRGFPAELLKNGVQPFWKGGGEGHFGMGLYICSLLCERHGGSLTLHNTEKGAEATAVFAVKALPES